MRVLGHCQTQSVPKFAEAVLQLLALRARLEPAQNDWILRILRRLTLCLGAIVSCVIKVVCRLLVMDCCFLMAAVPVLVSL